MQKFEIGNESPLSEHNGATFFVDLPTKGRFYPSEHPLHNKEQVEVKMMTTKEEEILTNPSYIEKNLTMDKLLQSVLNLSKIEASELFDADQFALMIALRIDAYDSNYGIVTECKSCGEEYNFDVNLEEILSKVDEGDVEKTINNTFVTTLPKSGKSVEYKLLTPKDLALIQKTTEKLKSMNVNTSFLQELYKRIILSIDGSADPQEKDILIKSMRIMDSRFLFATYAKSIPELDLNVVSTCEHCSHQQEGGMPIQANFFFPEF